MVLNVTSCFLLAGVLIILPLSAWSLDNGLARTPPMGWLAWERFRCITDCVNEPDNCISERLFMRIADKMVKDGYAAVGYEYIVMDDCWLAKTRDKNGKLQPDPDRFPSGIKALADYVHARGLKFGIYEDYGNMTCGGYPGITEKYFNVDANTFASWGVDYVKIDGCYTDPKDMDKGYPEFGLSLNRTGRPMVYSCSWPAYQVFSSISPNYTAIKEACNLWRNYGDIDDSWDSVQNIIDYYADNQDTLIPAAGPGHWNDPDMLIIGDFGLSYEQSKSQMAIWAILASPLLMSVDLKTIKREYKAILKNKKVIAVNQDVLGIQGRRIYNNTGFEIWVRPITPVVNNDYSFSIVFLNRRTDGTPVQFPFIVQQLGLTHSAGYKVRDLFSNLQYGILKPDDNITVKVNPTGVVMLRFIAVSAPK